MLPTGPIPEWAPPPLHAVADMPARPPAAGSILPQTGRPDTELAPAAPGNPSMPPATVPQPGADRQRWTLTSWLFVRPDALATGLPSALAPGQAQLGGTQGGLRAALRLDRSGRLELHARLVTSGSDLSGAEAAAGLTWQPLARLPVHLSVERREPVVGGGGRSAFAAFASGGVSDVALPGRFRLNGYGAAGVVGARRRDLFAEGSATAHRHVSEAGPVSVEAGGGIWAAAQPGATRVDAGPSLRLRLATGTVQPVLSIDWRQRLAGDATPASGVAITLASDF